MLNCNDTVLYHSICMIPCFLTQFQSPSKWAASARRTTRTSACRRRARSAPRARATTAAWAATGSTAAPASTPSAPRTRTRAGSGSTSRWVGPEMGPYYIRQIRLPTWTVLSLQTASNCKSVEREASIGLTVVRSCYRMYDLQN